MKNINEYSTPETDGEWNRLACLDHPEFESRLADFARNTERRLAACRYALEESAIIAEDSNYSANGYIRTLISETLAATATP